MKQFIFSLHSRTGKGGCGAWSYNKQEGVCFLHNVDSCCGQFGKRINNSQFISGYHCTVCWSTKQGTECPCDVEDRTQEPGSAHSTGASKPLHLTPTVNTFPILMIYPLDLLKPNT